MNIHQEVVITCALQEAYQALSDAEIFAEFTGLSAAIDFVPGGEFCCFNGMILGRTIEFKPSRMIVQAWRVANWEEGIYSIVKFDFERMSEGTTKIILHHTGFPEQHRVHLEPGWHDNYWKPLKKYFEN
jgi:activator of HSP90 ATPase